MNKLFCNRCGKKELEQFYAYTEPLGIVEEKKARQRVFVLCPECGKEFGEWFKSHKNYSLDNLIFQTETLKELRLKFAK